MTDFNPNPFRGESSVPHVSEEFFKVYFVASQLALTVLLFPGRIFGSQVHPRRYNRDYLIACTDEAARRREIAKGKMGRQFVLKPTPTNHSWQKMWWANLHYKRWTQDRMGGGWIKPL